MTFSPLASRSADDALALVGRLHRGILSHSEWEGALRALAAYVGADFAVSCVWDKRRDDIIIYDGGTLNEAASASYQSHYQHIDPARSRLLDAPVGSIYVDQLDLGTQGIAESPFYGEFLYVHGIESVMAMMVDRSEDLDWVVGFQRVLGRPLFDVENAVALRGVLSHLQTAIRLKHTMRELQHAHAWSRVTLNKVAFPLIMVDDRLRVVSSNASGDQWLAQPDNPLLAQVPDAALYAAISQACGSEHAPAVAATFASTLPDAEGRHGTLLALPVAAPEGHLQELRRPCVLLVGVGLQPNLGPSEILMRDLFSLTRSEIALASKLANGLTLTEAAELAGIGRETARTHLKSVLRKTATRRQSELTALLAGLSMLHAH